MVNLFEKAKYGENTPSEKLKNACKVSAYLVRKSKRSEKAKEKK